MNKKILGLLLSGTAFFACADSFQDFNNNVYAEYQNLAPGNIQAYNQYGVGGTLQAKNNVWLNGYSVTGSNGSSSTLGDTGVKAGYAFQFLNGQDQGFQVIPYASFDVLQTGGAGFSGTSYNYGIGAKPEYRLLNSLKLSFDAGIQNVQNNLGGVNGNTYSNSGSTLNYNLTPEIQYDISKTILLGVGYTYSNSFNGQGDINNGGTTGINSFNAKVGWLF